MRWIVVFVNTRITVISNYSEKSPERGCGSLAEARDDTNNDCHFEAEAREIHGV